MQFRLGTRILDLGLDPSMSGVTIGNESGLLSGRFGTFADHRLYVLQLGL